MYIFIYIYIYIYIYTYIYNIHIEIEKSVALYGIIDNIFILIGVCCKK